MSRPHGDDQMPARRRELAAQRRECLAREPDKALNRILAHPQPAALVHSFPEEDYFFLLQDIGPDDAHPLIALGSRRQLEYVLDQQAWDRDRIDLKALTQWLDRFVAADTRRTVRWLGAEKANLLEIFFFNVIDIRIRAHDQDPSEFGPGFTSFDNYFYVRIRDVPAPEVTGAVSEKHYRRLVRRLLEGLAEEDHVAYQRMLLGAMHVLPAEAEEEAYRLRNVRLAEKGFLPFEEAVGLYQPLRFDRFQQTAARFQRLPAGDRSLPMVPLTLLDSEDLFSRALQTFSPDEALEQIQSEFAALCNRLAVADRRKVAGRDDLRAVVRKACGYLNIGLERLDPASADAASAARQIRSFTLEGLFRLGSSQAAGLKQAAERWVAASWFARNGLPLTFWGEEWLGAVGGLLLKRPLFYDNYRTGRLYREFASLADIHSARRQLNQVQAVDRLLDQMQIERPARRRYGHLTYKNVLLTLWARSAIGLTDTLRPIAADAFRPFWASLFEPAADDSAAGRRIGNTSRKAFRQWLARRAKQEWQGLEPVIGPLAEALLSELEAEYGRVSAAAIEPRYIAHFLLEKPESAPPAE